MNTSSSSPDPSEYRGWTRQLFHRMEVDQAVFFSLLLRIWQLGAGIVSLLLISRFFSPAVQGFYFTFSSIIALQMFFELGLHIVVVSTTSHEWASLQLDAGGRICGDLDSRSRVISLGRKLALWYAGVGLVYAAIVGTAGVLFFSARPDAEVVWRGPWCWQVALTACLLWLLPLTSLLEGCNQVATVSRYRLIQAVFANLTLWVAISFGAGLWAAVLATAMRVTVEGYLIAFRYRRFFAPFLVRSAGATVRWAEEIWPMQWRIAAGRAFSYFDYSFLVPVMFHYHGPAWAGRTGMTWTLAIAFQTAALSWVQTRLPRFGMLIAKGDYRQLDRLFFRLTGISCGVLVSMYWLAWAAIWIANAWDVRLGEVRLADRLLPPWPTALYFATLALYQLPRCQDLYLRAHRREPLMALRVGSSCLIGGLVWWLGAYWGPVGSGWGYLGAVAIFVLPTRTWLWLRCRRAWH